MNKNKNKTIWTSVISDYCYEGLGIHDDNGATYVVD